MSGEWAVEEVPKETRLNRSSSKVNGDIPGQTEWQTDWNITFAHYVVGCNIRLISLIRTKVCNMFITGYLQYCCSNICGNTLVWYSGLNCFVFLLLFFSSFEQNSFVYFRMYNWSNLVLHVVSYAFTVPIDSNWFNRLIRQEDPISPYGELAYYCFLFSFF